MLQTLVSGIVGLLLLAGEVAAFEVQAVVVRVDAAQRQLIFTARQQQHTIRVPEEAKVLDAAGRELPDGLKATDLCEGAHVTLSVERLGEKMTLRAVRLAGSLGSPEDRGREAPPLPGEWEPFPDGSLGQVTEFHGVDGIRLPAYIRKPAGDGPFPVVVLLHGGKYSREATLATGRSTRAPVEDFLEQGWAVYAIDYRPVEKIAIVPMEIDDCIGAIKTLRQMPFVDSRRVGLMGTSHGAQLSSRLVSIIDLYVAKLRAAGKQVDTYLPDNGPHGFYWGHPDIPETKEAARRAVAFFQKQFGEETDDEPAVGNTLPVAQSSGPAKATQYQYGPMDWVDPDRTEPEGTRYATFHSQTIDADVSYLVYLPPDYEEQLTVRYPVLYYLHASGGTPRRDGAEIVRRLEKAVRAGRVSPMIVIMPNGLRGNTMYCDSRDGQYPVETVIINDLIPHVDATYRTVASREGRAVEGFSMGAFGAAHLGFKYPELFGVVSIQAPPLLGPELTSPLPARAWSKLFPTAMGGDLEYFQANDPFTLAAKNSDSLRDRTLIRIVCHVEDENWLAPRCEELHQLLMQHMIPHEFYFLSNVKSHNRAQVLDTLGDSEFSFFSSALPRWPPAEDR